MSKVRDLIKKHQAGTDTPPDAAAIKLRLKHIPEGIDYNHGHAFDHIDDNVQKIKKMKKVDPKQAKKLAKECIDMLHEMEANIKKAAGM